MADIFCSRDVCYRDPFGAVSAGTAVHFRLAVPRSLGCSAAFLRVTEQDRHSAMTGMFWAGMKDDVTEWWECHFTPDHAALYWYDFVLDTTEGRQLLRRAAGGRAELCSERHEPRCWQLTCYAADFATPAWLKGGVMYQIFHDRLF